LNLAFSGEKLLDFGQIRGLAKTRTRKRRLDRAAKAS
jgi:hypothetical protein